MIDLHRQFHALGAGVIEEVRVQRDKGFGFVRYSTHAEAALAIQMGNARILCGKPIKVISIVLFYVQAMLLFEWTCSGSPFFIPLIAWLIWVFALQRLFSLYKDCYYFF